jgi:uncharacterized sulfatase
MYRGVVVVWVLAVLVLYGGGGCGERSPLHDRPNVVLIIGDDLGYGDLGFMGSPYARTPNLDRLASEGTVFSRGYSTGSVCKPALQTLLTGVDPFQRDLLRRRGRGSHRIESHEPTIPWLLRSRGYASFHAGKLWEDSAQEVGFDSGTPVRRGKLYRTTDLGRPSIQAPLDFVDAHLDRPFFLWFAPMLPHVPFDAPARFEAPYRDMPLSAAERGYFANVTRFDDVVGQLVSHLEQRGLTERTVVIYLNDNGWDRAHFDDVGLNGPRGKGTIYDLGFRTPIVVWAPGRVRTGVHRDLVSILDVMPTVLDLAGVPIPPSLLGQSLRAALHGGAVPGREAIVGWRPPEWSAFGARRRVRGEQFFVRTDRWRYVWQPDTASQGLYRIETDPREEHDVLAEFPAVGRELRAHVQPWVAERSRAIAGPPRLAREARPVQ